MTTFEDMLIQKIREYRVLVDSSSRSQKNVKDRDEAWRRVSKDLGVSVGKCRQRWKSLRDRFQREKKLMRDPDYLEFEQWEFYRSMEFLDEFHTTREITFSDEDTSMNIGFEEYLTEIPPKTNGESSTKKRRTQTHDQFEELFTSLNKVFTERTIAEQPDDNDMFTKLIVRKMKVLPTRNQLRLQEKIFQLANQELLTFLEAQ